MGGRCAIAASMGVADRLGDHAEQRDSGNYGEGEGARYALTVQHTRARSPFALADAARPGAAQLGADRGGLQPRGE